MYERRSYRRRWLVGVSVVCLSFGCPVAQAQEEVDKQAAKRARDFLSALARADTNALNDFYADKVVVLARSELLHPQWGLNPRKDKNKDLAVERAKLIGAYEALIGKIGEARWVKHWAGIDLNLRAGLTIAKAADQPAAGIKKGDLVVTLRPGKADDQYIYILRPDKKRVWRVIIEGADY
jgi:hypothetical protein